MSNFEHGSFLFESGITQKTINFNNNYNNPVVIKITPINKNINVYLTDVQNNYFIIEKNTQDEVNINYVVIESES
jgi:hypothetical protein